MQKNSMTVTSGRSSLKSVVTKSEQQTKILPLSKMEECPRMTDAELTDFKRQQKILKRIELKCLEMKEIMLAQSQSLEFTELRISRFRQMLMKKEGLPNLNVPECSNLLPLPVAATAAHSVKVMIDENVKKKRSSDHSKDLVEEATESQTKRSRKSSDQPSLSSEPLNTKHPDSLINTGHKKRITKPKNLRKSSHDVSKSRSSSRDQHSPSQECVDRTLFPVTAKNQHKSTASPELSMKSPKSGKSDGSSWRSAGAGIVTSPSTDHVRKHRDKSHNTPQAYSQTVSSRRDRRSYSKSVSPKYGRSRSPVTASPLSRRDKSRERHSRSSSGGRWSRNSRYSASWSPSRSRSPSVRRRKGSPSHLDRRRITSARKRPVPYYRPSPSSSSGWSSCSCCSCVSPRYRNTSPLTLRARFRSSPLSRVS